MTDSKGTHQCKQKNTNPTTRSQVPSVTSGHMLQKKKLLVLMHDSIPSFTSVVTLPLFQSSLPASPFSNQCPTGAGDWAAFNSPGSAMSTPATAPWHAQSMGNRVQFTPPPKALKQPTEADLAAVDNGESLQLLETWQGSFAGSKLLKAGSVPKL